MIKLKPCPFCGGEVMLSYSSKGYFEFRHKMYGVCPFNEFRIWIEPIKDVACFEDAAEAWNRRDGE